MPIYTGRVVMKIVPHLVSLMAISKLAPALHLSGLRQTSPFGHQDAATEIFSTSDGSRIRW